MEHEFQILQLVLGVIKALQLKNPDHTVQFELFQNCSGSFLYYENADEFVVLESFGSLADLNIVISKYFNVKIEVVEVRN